MSFSEHDIIEYVQDENGVVYDEQPVHATENKHILCWAILHVSSDPRTRADYLRDYVFALSGVKMEFEEHFVVSCLTDEYDDCVVVMPLYSEFVFSINESDSILFMKLKEEVNRSYGDKIYWWSDIQRNGAEASNYPQSFRLQHSKTVSDFWEDNPLAVSV